MTSNSSFANQTLACSINSLHYAIVSKNNTSPSFFPLPVITDHHIPKSQPVFVLFFMEEGDANLINTLPTLSVMILMILSNLLLSQF